MLEWINTQVAGAIALTIIHSLWQGIVIALLVLLLARISYFRLQENAYALHIVALGTLFLCSTATFIAMYGPGSATPLAVAPGMPWTGTSGLMGESDATWWSRYWKEVIALSWAAGTIFCALRFAYGSARVIRLRRRATPAERRWQERLQTLGAKLGISSSVQLLSTDRGTVPFVFGVIRPVIIFPAVYFTQLTPAQFESILLHELAHVSRHDFLINILQIVVESVLFFNPAVWWMSSRIRMHREFCCDDYVQSRVESRKSYLEALYHVAQMSFGVQGMRVQGTRVQGTGGGQSNQQSTINNQQSPIGVVALFHNNSELIMRVKRMLNQPHTRTSLRPLITGGLGALLVFCLFSFETAPMTEAWPEVAKRKLAEVPVLSSVLQKLPPVAVALGSDVDLAVQDKADPAVRSDIGIMAESAGHDEIDSQIGKPLPSPRFLNVRDTTPEQRMAELEAKMKAKEQEMEALAQKMEQTMEHDMEAHMRKMEEVAARLEAMHEAREEEMEARMENSAEMRRMEELSEQLEEKMEQIEIEMEEKIDHEALEQLEREMEARTRELEMMQDSLPVEEIQRLAEELQQQIMEEREALLGPIMEQVEAQIAAVRDTQVQRIHQEMAELQQRMAASHERMFAENPEMEELRKQLQEMEIQLHEKMSPLREKFAKQMAEQALEMEEIAREMRALQKELHKNRDHQGKQE